MAIEMLRQPRRFMPSRSVTFTVAAADAPEREQAAADFLCDGTNDHAEIQAAISLLPSAGGVVHLSSGTFVLGDEISIPSNTTLEGEGRDLTILQIAASANSGAIENSDQTNGNSRLVLRGFRIDGNRTNQTNGAPSIEIWRSNLLVIEDIGIDETFSECLELVNCVDFFVERVEASNGAAGVQGIRIATTAVGSTGVARGRIVGCYARSLGLGGTGAGDGIYIDGTNHANGAVDLVIAFNIVTGCNRSGIVVQSGDRLAIFGNVCRDNGVNSTQETAQIWHEGSLNSVVVGNYCDATGASAATSYGIVAGARLISGNVVEGDASTDYGIIISANNSLVEGNSIIGTSMPVGIGLSSALTGVAVLNNRVTGCIKGVSFFTSVTFTRCVVRGNAINIIGGTGDYVIDGVGETFVDCDISDNIGNISSGLSSDNGIELGTVTRTKITGNILRGDGVGSIRGINITVSATDSILDGNIVSGYVTNNYLLPSGLLVRNNVGFVSRNSGTATIASGTTSVAITHGISQTPALDDISVSFGENPTNDPGNWWISAIGATTFTVNVRADPGVSALDLAWRVDMQRTR